MRSAKVAPAPLPSEQENDVPNGTSEVAPSMVRPAIPAQDEAATAEQQATRLRLLFAEAVASELRAAGRKDTSGVRAGCTQLRATDSGHTLALGSAATILLCLRDSRTAPRFGELPALDELLARELRHGIGAYCEHLLGLAHRAVAAAAAAAWWQRRRRRTGCAGAVGTRQPGWPWKSWRGARVDMSAERRGGPSRTGATIKRGG